MQEWWVMYASLEITHQSHSLDGHSGRREAVTGSRMALHRMIMIDMHLSWCDEILMAPLITRFMGPTWGPSGADRTQVGPMLAPWILLSRSVQDGGISSALTILVPNHCMLWTQLWSVYCVYQWTCLPSFVYTCLLTKFTPTGWIPWECSTETSWNIINKSNETKNQTPQYIRNVNAAFPIIFVYCFAWCCFVVVILSRVF